MPRGADVIAAKLASIGCRTAFGIPGGEVLAIVDALEQSGIQFCLTKHENPAGFMAEGSWHATGAPGILVATIGPGVANAVNVVANAMQDRVPLIFLTGCVDDAVGHTYTHQVFDHQAVLRPIVKASLRAATGALGAVMDKALTIAREGQPGPVHIDVPIGVAEGQTDEAVGPVPSLPALPCVSAGDLDRLSSAIERAQRPLVIAGVDAVNEEAGDAIADFCRSWGIPLVASYKGKGLLPEDDPLALGGAGLSPKADGQLLPLAKQADLILLFGYDPIEMRIGWRDPWGSDADVIEVTTVTRTHGMHRVDHTIRAGIGRVLGALPRPDASPDYWPDGEPAAVRATLRAAFAPSVDGFGPDHVFATLREVLPRDTVTTADSGAHRILVSQMWACYSPRTMLQSSALCTMGCAVPIAAGYKFMRPDVPVVAFIGDAGLEMILGDLATLRDLKTPVIITVLCDESLALIEKKQRAQQLANAGVDFTGTDFPTVAQGLGGYGVWIDNTESLKEEAARALARDTFTILACRIPRRAYDGLI